MATNKGIEWKDCWKKPVKVQYREITETTEINTREGKLFGYAGKDVLIKGVRGEVYPCKIDIFNETYTTAEARADERQKIQKLEKALSEYLNLLEEDRRLFPLTLSGDDEPQPTKYMGYWIANTFKLKKSEEKLIKIFGEYKAKGEKK